MKMTASEVKNRFGEAIDIALSGEDVLIVRHGRVVAFIGSADDYKLFREFKLQRLREKLTLREAEADRGEFVDDSLKSIQDEAFKEFQKGEKL